MLKILQFLAFTILAIACLIFYTQLYTLGKHEILKHSNTNSKFSSPSNLQTLTPNLDITKESVIPAISETFPSLASYLTPSLNIWDDDNPADDIFAAPINGKIFVSYAFKWLIPDSPTSRATCHQLEDKVESMVQEVEHYVYQDEEIDEDDFVQSQPAMQDFIVKLQIADSLPIKQVDVHVVIDTTQSMLASADIQSASSNFSLPQGLQIGVHGLKSLRLSYHMNPTLDHNTTQSFVRQLSQLNSFHVQQFSLSFTLFNHDGHACQTPTKHYRLKNSHPAELSNPAHSNVNSVESSDCSTLLYHTILRPLNLQQLQFIFYPASLHIFKSVQILFAPAVDQLANSPSSQYEMQRNKYSDMQYFEFPYHVHFTRESMLAFAFKVTLGSSKGTESIICPQSMQGKYQGDISKAVVPTTAVDASCDISDNIDMELLSVPDAGSAESVMAVLQVSSKALPLEWMHVHFFAPNSTKNMRYSLHRSLQRSATANPGVVARRQNRMHWHKTIPHGLPKEGVEVILTYKSGNSICDSSSQFVKYNSLVQLLAESWKRSSFLQYLRGGSDGGKLASRKVDSEVQKEVTKQTTISTDEMEKSNGHEGNTQASEETTKPIGSASVSQEELGKNIECESTLCQISRMCGTCWKGGPGTTTAFCQLCFNVLQCSEHEPTCQEQYITQLCANVPENTKPNVCKHM